jgi:glutaminyl-tRNA synthetase
MQDARSLLNKWADGKALRSEVDLQVLSLLGPKTDEDLAPAPKQNDKKANKAPKEKKVEKAADDAPQEKLSMAEFLKTKVLFHKPGMNYTTDGYVTTPKTMDLLKQHLKITGGKV